MHGPISDGLSYRKGYIYRTISITLYDNTRILFWNTQGATRKRLELQQFVQEQNVDILLLNETHLSSSQKFKLPNFHSYYSNKTQTSNQPPAGGTAVLVNRRFIHQPAIIPTTSITNTAIHIHTGNAELRLVAVYKSPKDTLQTSDLDALLNTPTNTIIAGDLNAKHTIWQSRVNNNAGVTLSRYLDSRLDIANRNSCPNFPHSLPKQP